MIKKKVIKANLKNYKSKNESTDAYIIMGRYLRL